MLCLVKGTNCFIINTNINLQRGSDFTRRVAETLWQMFRQWNIPYQARRWVFLKILREKCLIQWNIERRVDNSVLTIIISILENECSQKTTRWCTWSSQTWKNDSNGRIKSSDFSWTEQKYGWNKSTCAYWRSKFENFKVLHQND